MDRSKSVSETASFTDVLEARGPFTIFIPTDEAFKKLASGALEELLKESKNPKAVLNYRVVPGRLMIADVKSGEATTLQDSTLAVAVSGTDVRVKGACVTQTNVAATNGIHVINTVLLPKNLQHLAIAA